VLKNQSPSSEGGEYDVGVETSDGRESEVVGEDVVVDVVEGR